MITKIAITVENDPGVIGKLLSVPQIRSAIEQHAAGFVDKIIVTSTGADIQQTQQRLNTDPNAPKNVELPQPTGNPYGHMFTYQDPNTHQHKPLDRIVRIDRVTDEWGTLVTIMHEIAHHRHPDWSESQVESEGERLASDVKQYLPGQQVAASLKILSNVLNKYGFDKEAEEILELIKTNG